MSQPSIETTKEGLSNRPAEPYENKMARLELKVSISTPLQAAEQAKSEADSLKSKYGDAYQGFKSFVERYQTSWTFSAKASEAIAEYNEVSTNLKNFDQIFEALRANQNRLDFAKKLGVERPVAPQYMIETALRELVSDPNELSLIGLFALVKASGTAMQRTLQSTWSRSYFSVSSLPALVQTAKLKGIL